MHDSQLLERSRRKVTHYIQGILNNINVPSETTAARSGRMTLNKVLKENHTQNLSILYPEKLSFKK